MAFLTKRNKNYYICYYDADKKKKFLSTRTGYKAMALKKLTEFNNRENLYFNKRITFEKMLPELERYINNNFSKKTIYIYKFTSRKFLEVIGNRDLNHYSISDFEQYKETRNREISITSLNIELRCLKAIFNLAYKKGFLFRKTASDIIQISEPESSRGYFEKDDIIKITDSLKNKVVRNIVLFAYYTGCRINEILNLRLDSIDLNKSIINIENTKTFKTKTRRNRKIPISKNLTEIIQARNGNTTYLFETYGRPYNQNYISRKFKGAIRKLQFPENLTFHCLRHSFITNLINSGIEINTVKELAGHTCIDTTLKYCHSDDERKRKAIDCL